jgi:hypothetical protein
MSVIAAFSAGAIPAAGHYVHWGVVSVSLTNLLIVVAMLVLFGLALVLPFPRARAPSRPRSDLTEDDPS